MNRKNVLLISHHFPPSAASGSFRLTGFARHLPKYGWGTVAVTPQPGALAWEPQDPALLEELTPETVIVRASYNTSLLSYPLRYLWPVNSWLGRSWWVARRAVRQHRPEVLMTSGPPHAFHTVGLLLKREFGLPWVADFRDPWVACNRYFQADRFWSRLAARVERAVMRQADVVLVNTPNARAALAEAYPKSAGRMRVITNGYDPERFPRESTPSGEGAPLRVVHTGQFYSQRKPDAFLDAVQSLERGRPADMRGLRVEFIGNLDATVDVRSAIDSRGLGASVHLSDHMPYAETLGAMASADLLLLVDDPGRLRGAPAKLYEYLGAGRPVLALVEPESDSTWVLEESGVLYRTASPSDPAAIRRALVELATEIRVRDGRPAGGDGRLAFTRERLAGKLAEAFDDCVAAKRTGRVAEAGVTA